MSGDHPVRRFGGAFGYRGVSTTATELRIDTDLAFADWQDLVLGLVGAWTATQWWVGDALCYGERRYGESFAQVAATLAQRGVEVAPSTLQQWTWIASRVAPSRRRENLRFSIHVEVAALPPNEQTKWLDAAAENGWGVRQLREAVATSKAVPIAEPASAGASRPPETDAADVQAVARALLHAAEPLGRGRSAVPDDALARLARAIGESWQPVEGQARLVEVEPERKREPWS